MPLSIAQQDALLQWVNTFSLQPNAESFRELEDGIVLFQILEEIYPGFAPSTPPTHKPLKLVATVLYQNVRQAEVATLDALLETPGLNAVAQSGESDHIIELVVAIFMAAVFGCSDNVKFLTAIRTDLSADSQQEIMGIIQSVQTTPGQASTPLSEDITKNLKIEARLTQALARSNTLEDKCSKLERHVLDKSYRCDELQDSNTKLKEELKVANGEIRGLSKERDITVILDNLKLRVQEQEDVIHHLETQINDNRIEKESFLEEFRNLKNNSLNVQALQDEVSVLRKANDQLQREANRNENLLKKLGQYTSLEKDNIQLKQELEDLRDYLKDFEMVRYRKEQLETTQTRFQSAVRTQEDEIDELRRQKKLLEAEINRLDLANQIMEDKRIRDEEMIDDLQKKLRGEAESVIESTSSTTDATATNLEAELSGNRSTERHNLHLVSLRTQVEELKRIIAAGQDKPALLEESETARKRLQTKYEELFEKHVVAEQQVEAILSVSTAEGLVKGIEAAMLVGDLTMLTPEYRSTQAFTDLRNAHLRAVEIATKSEARFNDTKAELDDVNRKLLLVQNDLIMIEQDDMDALESLKRTQETILSSLENELAELRSQHKVLRYDYDQQKSQLVSALLAKDDLSKSLEAASSSKTDGKAQKVAGNTNASDKSKDQDSILAKDQEIRDLQAQVAAYKAGGVDPEENAKLKQENFNLERESRMMTSAWFDLSQRLQSSSVVLERRRDSPRSWINQQRQAINQTVKR